MLEFVIRHITVARLKAANYNPPNRVEAKKLKALQASMKAIGQIYPILVNKSNEVIDGHRRLTVARMLGWATICCKVVEVDDAMSQKIYAAISASSAKMTSNDYLGIWLRCRNAVPERIHNFYVRVQELIGKQMLERIYKAGLSGAIFRMARKISVACKSESPETIAMLIDWMMRKEMAATVSYLLSVEEDPHVIFNAARKDKVINVSPR